VISAATGRPAAATPKPNASSYPPSWELITSDGLVVIGLTADKEVWVVAASVASPFPDSNIHLRIRPTSSAPQDTAHPKPSICVSDAA
jgi:hypothetical protein